jgi:hypothetical protein
MIANLSVNSVYAKLQECGYTADDLSNVRSSEVKDIVTAWKKQTEQPKILNAKGGCSRESFEVSVFKIHTVWDKLHPKLDALIERDRQQRHQRAVEKSRPILWGLLRDRINSFESDGRCSVPGHGICKAEYIYVSNIEQFGCQATSAFMEANEGKDLYDGVGFLPDEAWDKLVEDGILGKLDELRHFAEDILNKYLVDGVTRIPNSALAVYTAKKTLPPVTAANLPKSFSVHHSAAFFHVDSQYRNTDFYKDLKTYPEIVTSTDIYDKLKRHEGDRKQQIGVTSGNSSLGPDDWCSLRRKRYDIYEGDRHAATVALVLLRNIGYDAEEHAHSSREAREEESSKLSCNRKGYATMKEMERKGEVFVCLCCPEEGRTRRTWRELVSENPTHEGVVLLTMYIALLQVNHFYEEAGAFDDASRTYE